MDLKSLMSGIGVVIDDALDKNNGNENDGIFQIMKQINDHLEIPLFGIDRIPSSGVCHNLLQSASFILLDWKLWANGEQLEREGIKRNVEFLNKAKDYFIPVLIFTNEALSDVECEIEGCLYSKQHPENNFIFIKTKTDVIDESEFDSLKNWIKINASVYTLKAWEQAFYKSKRKLFSSMYSKSADWPKIFWKSYEKDGVDPNSSLTRLINDNLLGRFKSGIFKSKLLDSNYPDVPGEDIRLLLNEACFLSKDNLAKKDLRAGDLFKMPNRKYLINIRPDCDCVPRTGNNICDVELYCIEGKTLSDKKINEMYDDGHFNEKIWENITFCIYNKKTIQFHFKKLRVKKYAELKGKRVGRLLHPYITKIQQNFTHYLQRQGLPRIPEEALLDCKIDLKKQASAARDQMIQNRSQIDSVHVPENDRSGIYSVYARNQNCLPGITTPSNGILYVGESGDLAKRGHFETGKTRSSSLRRSLGAILKKKLNLVAIPRGGVNDKRRFSNFCFTEKGEDKLSEWMYENLEYAIYFYKENTKNRRELEQEIIRISKPPLNLNKWPKENPNPQRRNIMKTRGHCMKEAKQSEDQS